MKVLTDCKKYKEMIMEVTDGEASADTIKEAGLHTESCPDCAKYEKSLIKMGELTSLMKVEAPEFLETRIMASISGKKPAPAFNWAPLLSYAASFAVILFVSVFIIYNKPSVTVKDLAKAPAAPAKAVVTAKAPSSVKYAKAVVKPAVVAALKVQSAPVTAAKAAVVEQPVVVAAVPAPAAAPAVSMAPALQGAASQSQPAAAIKPADNVNYGSSEISQPVNTMHEADANKITATPTVVMTDIGVVADNLINPRLGQCAKIRVQVAQDGSPVKIIIYDKAARVVAVVLNETKDAGLWESDWCGQNYVGATVSQGVYPVYIQVGQSVTKKFIIVTK
ncbi:MAG: hypothetical protein ABSA34_04665 [Candidatus Goldiibacteriota bacterium]